MRRMLFIFAVLTAALALNACGKRAELRPPDDATEAYTYPKAYPKPSSVGPAAAGTATEEEEPRALTSPDEVPTGAGRLSVFPSTRRTTTYGTPPQ